MSMIEGLFLQQLQGVYTVPAISALYSSAGMDLGVD